MSITARRNPLAAQTDITLATETNGPQLLDLLPGDIHIDAGLQTRDKMSQETITEYAEAMLNGDQFPPLVVYHNGATHALVKGFHRIKAHAMAFGEDKPIRCKIIHGNRREALKEALADNADHGLRLTREDKRKKVKIALADEEWGQWSDREIAKLCKVSHPLVAEVRREVTGNSSSDQPRTYNTRHGTQSTMNTERIRQANSARQVQSAKAVYAPTGDDSPKIKPLTVDETLAVILRFIERGCNSTAPGLQLDFLRRNTEPRAYLPAVNPERTLDSKCFREAWRQAEVLLDAEVKKATRSSTIIQRIETEYDTANPLAPPVTVPEPVEGAVTAIALPPFPVKDGPQFLAQTRRAISTLEEEGWSTVADFLRAVCRMAENGQPEQNADSPPQTRSQHINQMLSHYRTIIDLLPDYGELTGDYSGTLPLRRVLEPMIRKLEENLV